MTRRDESTNRRRRSGKRVLSGGDGDKMVRMSDRVVLVTGATGLVGNAIVRALHARGDRVRALVRDPERARSIVPAGVELAPGDILVRESLEAALADAVLVFHAAGMPEQWQPDESVFDRVNRGGTKEVLTAAHRARVTRVVYTSTMDVFAATPGGTLVESNVDHRPKATAYERSKQAAERDASNIQALGLDVVYVNPGAVYGPSPVIGTLNAFIQRLLAGKVPLLPPGGMSLAFLDGVVAVHLAAADRGRRGERYLVADEHLSTADIAREVMAAEGRGRAVPKTAPLWLMRALASASAPIARALGTQPLIAPGELSFLTWNAHVDASKAKQELGFRPTPAREGIRKTVDALLHGTSNVSASEANASV
jgi:dihydroflavonol-4-reductase